MDCAIPASAAASPELPARWLWKVSARTRLAPPPSPSKVHATTDNAGAATRTVKPAATRTEAPAAVQR